MKNHNSKSILYLRTDIYNQPVIAGGSVTHTMGVLKGFLHHNYSLIIASCPQFEQYKQLVDNIIPLQNPRWLCKARWKLNCLFSNIFFTIQIIRSFPTKKPKFIYQRYSILNCTGVIISRLKKIPLMLEYNGSEAWVDAHWTQHHKRFRFARLIAWIEKINLKYAHSITVVSQTLKKELIARGISEKKIIVNCNGVDIEQFNPARLFNERETMRKQYGFENNFVFGFVGTFCVWHGINILAEIIPTLIQKHDNIRFLLMGDGLQKKWLEKHLEETVLSKDRHKIIFTGIISPENIADYLTACDAFLCPTQPNPDNSDFFGSPTKLFEYLSMAKPIIASNIGQIKDIIRPALEIEKIHEQPFFSNAIGILVNPTKSSDFIAAANYLLQLSTEQARQIGIEARKKAEKEYQWNAHVQRIIAFSERNL